MILHSWSKFFFYFFWHFVNISLFCKSGGLDSQDQSRLRTSIVSRPTFLKCQDFLDGQDQLFFSRSRFLKLRLFSREFDLLRFLSRLLRRVKIVEICRDLKNLDIVKAFWIWKCWKVLTCWEISTRKYKNPLTSRPRLRQTVKNAKIFRSRWISQSWDKIEKSWSQSSRLTFLKCRDKVFEMSRSRVSMETTSRQIETPRLFFCFNSNIFNFHWWSVQLTFFRIMFQMSLCFGNNLKSVFDCLNLKKDFFKFDFYNNTKE